MTSRGPYNDLDTDKRVRFWDHMIARHPHEETYAKRTKDGMRWHRLLEGRVVVSLAIGIDFVRVFVRGDLGASADRMEALLRPHADALAKELRAPLRSPGDKDRFFSSRLNIDMTDETNWDQAADDLWDTSQRYELVLTERLGRVAR